MSGGPQVETKKDASSAKEARELAAMDGGGEDADGTVSTEAATVPGVPCLRALVEQCVWCFRALLLV